MHISQSFKYKVVQRPEFVKYEQYKPYNKGLLIIFRELVSKGNYFLSKESS